jgi:phage-related protein
LSIENSVPDIPKPRIPVIFYRSASGREPVREWLRDMDPEDRRVVGLDLMRVQEQWPIGMPVCRSLGQGLWEVRSNLPGGRTARIMFFIAKDRIGAVHGFIKKTRSTPNEDLALASRRMKEMLA